MTYALALDLGTTTICTVAVGDDGRMAGNVRLNNTAPVPGLPAGHAEQNPRELWRLSCEALRQLAGQLDAPPHCLGLTGQMHGTLIVDSARQPLTNLITWQDRRGNAAGPGTSQTWLQAYLDRCAEDDLARTGCRLSAGYAGVTLFTLREQGQLPDHADKAAFLANWIGAELCDEPLVTDRSNAAAAGVYDLARDCWSAELLEAGGLPPRLFPEVQASGAVRGRLSAAAAALTGLPAGLPVCNAIGDNQAAVLGSVPAGSPAIQINIGTGGQINWPVPSFERVEGMDTRYLPHNRFMLVGAGLAGGDAYAWVNRTAQAWLAAFGMTLGSDEIYDRLNALAASRPAGNDGLQCAPLFRGTRRQPQARGTFAGVEFGNFTPGHVARAVLQGIAQALHGCCEQAGPAEPRHLTRIIGSGNGLRRNPLLVQVLAETFGREVWLSRHEEEAAYGAALLAGSATGLWPDLETAGRRIELRLAAAPVG